MQTADRRIFGRMFDLFAFPSNGDNSVKGNSKPSSNTKGKSRMVGNMFVGTREGHAEYKVSSLKEFKFADLKRATSNFSSAQLCEGSPGNEFVGWVDKNTFAPSIHSDGIVVAVKRNCLQNDGEIEEWLAEVNVLGQLAHPNIISLLGYCNDKKHEYLLVYEYMQNKTLDSHLNPADIAAEPLSWGTRLRIMIGVARGLSYLHSSNVIHRDVQSINILLDQDFNAKLRGFMSARLVPEIGESHVYTFVQRTLGYLDPEYFHTSQLTVKSDVYSFGVVLLQTLTGLQAFDMNQPYETRHLVRRAIQVLEDKVEWKKIIDPRLEKNYPEEGAFEYAKLALRCTSERSVDRPSSEEVLLTLEQIYAGSK